MTLGLRSIAAVCGVVMAAGLASACDDDRVPRARKAAEAWRNYAAANPPNEIWKAEDIRIEEGGEKVVMDVLVPIDAQVAQIRARTRMQQVRIVHALGCPPAEAPVWEHIGRGQSLWVNLKSETEVLIGSSCPSPE